MIFEFTLKLDRDPEPFADALYEAGLSDSLLATGPDGHTAAVDRDASSFWDAVTSAISEVQQTPVRVTAIESDRFLTGVDVATELGLSRQHISRLTHQGDFPAPARRVGPRVVLYSRNAILAWARETGRLREDVGSPTSNELGLVDALNARLAWRATESLLDAQSLRKVNSLAA